MIATPQAVECRFARTKLGVQTPVPPKKEKKKKTTNENDCHSIAIISISFKK
jgi:hypothetical protein